MGHNSGNLRAVGTYLVNRIRSGAGNRQQPRIGAPDRSLTPNAGLAAISELCGRLGVIEALDAAVGPIKQRDRGFGAGELLTGIAAPWPEPSEEVAGLVYREHCGILTTALGLAAPVTIVKDHLRSGWA